MSPEKLTEFGRRMRLLLVFPCLFHYALGTQPRPLRNIQA
jgi:hypothetical protein